MPLSSYGVLIHADIVHGPIAARQHLASLPSAWPSRHRRDGLKACARPALGPGIEKGNDMQPYELTNVKVAELALDPSDVFGRQVPAHIDISPCLARAAERAR